MPKKSLLPAVWDVPQNFRDRLGEQAGRQRVMFHDGHLLLVLHTPPLPEDIERKGRYFWRKPDGAWSSTDLGAGPNALNRLLEEYTELLSKYDEADHEAQSAEEYFDVLYHVGPLLRAIRNTHQALQEARDRVVADENLINARDRAYQLERTAELLYGDAKNALDFTVAQRAEEQAENAVRMAISAHRLNILAAFFFPIATLSAVFGVNFSHGWERYAPPVPFLLMLGAGLAFGIVLTLFVTKPSPRPSPRSRAKGQTKTSKAKR